MSISKFDKHLRHNREISIIVMAISKIDSGHGNSFGKKTCDIALFFLKSTRDLGTPKLDPRYSLASSARTKPKWFSTYELHPAPDAEPRMPVENPFQKCVHSAG